MEEKKAEDKLLMMQRIVLRLSDGRQGVFAGPALVSEGELKLSAPKITNILFAPPYAIKVPEQVKKEDTSAPKKD